MTSGGNGQCNSNNQNYRVDTPLARQFLGQFLTLPTSAREGSIGAANGPLQGLSAVGIRFRGSRPCAGNGEGGI